MLPPGRSAGRGERFALVWKLPESVEDGMCDKHEGSCSGSHPTDEMPQGDQPVNPARRSAVRKSAAYLLAGVGIAVVGTTLSQPAAAGYGCCWKCACQGFEPAPGDSEHCSNCGHQYSDHGRICRDDHGSRQSR